MTNACGIQWDAIGCCVSGREHHGKEIPAPVKEKVGFVQTRHGSWDGDTDKGFPAATQEASTSRPQGLLLQVLPIALPVLLAGAVFAGRQVWRPILSKLLPAAWELAEPTATLLLVALLTLLTTACVATTSVLRRLSVATSQRTSEAAAVKASAMAKQARAVRERCWPSLDLPQEEVRKVRQLLSRVSDLESGNAPLDFLTACRFLRAQQWDVRGAEEAMRMAFDRRTFWTSRAVALGLTRMERKGICSLEHELLPHWRGAGAPSTDRDGDPIWWERMGCLDWTGLLSLSEDVLLCLEHLSMERMLRHLDERTVEAGRPIHRHTIVIDLEGLPIKLAKPANVRLLKQIIELDSKIYPETLKRVLLIRPPPKFYYAWKVIANSFSPRTQDKITLVSPTETITALQEIMYDREIPSYMLNPGWWPWSASPAKTTPIPKRLLRSAAERVQSEERLKEKEAGGPMVQQLLNGGGGFGSTFSAGKLSTSSTPPTKLLQGAQALVSPQKLVDMSASLRYFREFSAKQKAFPRSAWVSPFQMPPDHTWGVFDDASKFSVSAQLHRQRPMLECLDVDVFKRSEEHYIAQTYDHPTLAAQHFRRNGDTRFMFTVNWMCGTYQHVSLAALPQRVARSEGKSGQIIPGDEELERDLAMWQRFLSQPPEHRWRRLKVSAAVFDGPYILHDILRAQPTTRLAKFDVSHSESARHLEVAVQLQSSQSRRCKVVFEHSYNFIVNGLAYFLRGEGPNEPPERLLFAHYCCHVDVPKIRHL
eukprot:TRINITY_DN51726_c0_g1_i1.p1 TRINITY_DN51726_c0_g1~~TRINITY_DN51726_c0_g1_i1.p1  ORF type:complete len:764 (-),score=178.83 TRINITY_DN51726_c0_g1_i1:335-2626(-)